MLKMLERARPVIQMLTSSSHLWILALSKFCAVAMAVSESGVHLKEACVATKRTAKQHRGLHIILRLLVFIFHYIYRTYIIILARTSSEIHAPLLRRPRYLSARPRQAPMHFWDQWRSLLCAIVLPAGQCWAKLLRLSDRGALNASTVDLGDLDPNSL